MLKKQIGEIRSEQPGTGRLLLLFCWLLLLPAGLFAEQVPESQDVDQVVDETLGHVSGVAWLDADADRVFDEGEETLEKWEVRLVGSENALLASTRITSDGTYSIHDLPVGQNNTIQLLHVESNIVVQEIRDVALSPGVISENQNLPVVTGGVVYDAMTRKPLSGAVIVLFGDQGSKLPDVCLLSGQQNQVTGEDGRYFFDIQAGADPVCPDDEASYRLNISSYPVGYRASAMIPAQPGSFDTTPGESSCPVHALPGTPCQIQQQAVAPVEADETTYYLGFKIARDDQLVINNHIPLDAKSEGNSIWLLKSVSKAEAMVGDILQYSLRVQNSESIEMPGLIINDNLPAGFDYVVDSGKLVRAGADGVLETADDQQQNIVPVGEDPISFGPLDLTTNEAVLIRYFLRVSNGVVSGTHINTAETLAAGNKAVSNLATASVEVVQDPLLEKTTIIGKVFHDRDRDGFQDNADAGEITIRSDHFGWKQGKVLGDISGRTGSTSPIDEHRLELRMPVNKESNSAFVITSAEGSVIRVDSEGKITLAHQRKKRRGLTGQDLRIKLSRETAVSVDELLISISNHGIHEEGIPGVRLATVEGLLIETDQYGRFHIADVDTGRFDRSKNYIVKVDPATLPAGTSFTTENPRVLRLTQSLMTKFNFGVRLPEKNTKNIETPITRTLKNVIEPVRFASGKNKLSESFLARLQQLIRGLDKKQNLRLKLTGHTDSQGLSVASQRRYGDNLGLSVARAELVAELLLKRLKLSSEQVLIEGMGDTRPIAGTDTAEGMAMNRRVEIEVIYDEVIQGKNFHEREFLAHGPDRQLSLPHGGTIWVTEDPARMDPRLSVKAKGPLKLKANHPAAPVKFSIYSNYVAFIDRWELLIFADSDEDHLKPLGKLSGRELRQGLPVQWHGYLLDGKQRPVVGEHLRYILRVYDSNGFYDETAPQLLRVVETSLFGDNYTPRAALLSDEKTRTTVMDGNNHLVRQTIPLQGSRVRIYGADIRRAFKLRINDEKVNIDAANKFVWEQQLPLGNHEFNIEVDDGTGKEWNRQIRMDVDGQYFFMVGLANLTVGENDLQGNMETLAGDEHYGDEVWVDGRLAFYLKGKIQGKYLVTAQLDSQEDEIGNLGENLKRKDPQAVFRRLDPEAFYPVYGDDSTTISDVDTQGAFYVRVDWDKSRTLWGNYNTAFTGNEFAQYNRSLYGAQYIHKGLHVTKHGDNHTELYAFASEAQTAQAHNEFIATGGSLYYLRETDIVRGSEKIRVEVRARDSQRVVSTATLVEGRDYQIDYIQGRIILSQPLAQYAAQNMASIINDQPLEGDDVILLVDYEYVPAGFSGEELSAGLRGKGWLTDAIGIGATYVEEARENVTNYTLSGLDLTYRLGKNSWVKAEYAESEYSQNHGWISSNGGLSFAEIRMPSSNQDQGNAYGVNGQISLAEMTDEALQGRITAWFKSREAGFSSTRVNDGIDTEDKGVEVDWEASKLFKLQGGYSALIQDNKASSTFNLQARVKTTAKLTMIAETRRESSETVNDTLGFTGKGDATLAAVGAEYRVFPQSQLYGSVQTVVENSDSYEDNDAATLGVRTQVNDRLALKGEITVGDRGKSLQLGVAYDVNTKFTADVETGFGDAATTQVGSSYTTTSGTELYGSYAVDTDRTDKSTRTLTLGQRKRMSADTRIFSEEQFNENDQETGMTNVIGIDHKLNRELKLNLSLAHSDVDSLGGGDIQRDTLTTGLSYNDKRRLKASTKLEYRKDEGAEELTQWLTTNALDWKQSPNLRWLIRLNLSWTENDITDKTDGKFVEASLGFAYRPVFNDRFNFLGKYSYLYDLPAQLSSGSLVGQNDFSTDERAHILSLETLYDLDQHWELGGKLAWRGSETRASRDAGNWFDSGARLAALNLRYHFIESWDALAEYHVLQAETEENLRKGTLVVMYHHLNDHFKVGVGYNFTEFNDDLAQINDYDAMGLFVDFTGKF